jgi:hypothetical protein
MPDEPQGALLSVSGGRTLQHRLQMVAHDDLSRVLLVISDEEDHTSADQLRRAIHREATSTEDAAAAIMVCPLPYAFLLA